MDHRHAKEFRSLLDNWPSRITCQQSCHTEHRSTCPRYEPWSPCYVPSSTAWHICPPLHGRRKRKPSLLRPPPHVWKHQRNALRHKDSGFWNELWTSICQMMVNKKLLGVMSENCISRAWTFHPERVKFCCTSWEFRIITIVSHKVQRSSLFLLLGSNYLEPAPCFCPSFCLCQFFQTFLENRSLLKKLFFSPIALRYKCVCACACVWVCLWCMHWKHVHLRNV